MVRTLAAAAAALFAVHPLSVAAQGAGPAAPPAPPAPAFEPPPPPPAPTPVSPQAPPAPPQSMPGRMPHVRFYAGGAGVNQWATSSSGGAGLLGIQWYSDLFPIIQWYSGVELIGVGVGTGFLGVVDGDLGARLTPFPDWPLRPYLRANLGLSLVIIVPVPSAGLAVGMMLPIFNTIFLDIAFGVRRVYYVFDTTKSLDLGVMELSIGF